VLFAFLGSAEMQEVLGDILLIDQLTTHYCYILKYADVYFCGFCICFSTTTLHPFNSLFSRTTWVRRYEKDKTSLDLSEARDAVLGCHGINWTMCKQSASSSSPDRQPHQHNFYRLRALPDAQPTMSKYCIRF